MDEGELDLGTGTSVSYERQLTPPRTKSIVSDVRNARSDDRIIYDRLKRAGIATRMAGEGLVGFEAEHAVEIQRLLNASTNQFACSVARTRPATVC